MPEMNQTTATVAGAVFGLTTWLGFQSEPFMPSLFLSVVGGAWAGVALHAIVRDEIALAGKGPGPVTKVVGWRARALGAVLFLSLATLIVRILHAKA